MNVYRRWSHRTVRELEENEEFKKSRVLQKYPLTHITLILIIIITIIIIIIIIIIIVATSNDIMHNENVMYLQRPPQKT